MELSLVKNNNKMSTIITILIILNTIALIFLFKDYFKFCFFSRNNNNNLYCLTIFSVADERQSQPLKNDVAIQVRDQTLQTNNTITTFDHDDYKEHEGVTEIMPSKSQHDVAMEAADEYMRVLRSWRSKSNNSSSCDNKGIFIYDLDPKFNTDLVQRCIVNSWLNLCDYLTNDGMGEPIPRLGDHWHNTHQYSLELIFHTRIMNHPCRTHDPNSAKIFYVPFYAGLDILRWNFDNVSFDVKDELGIELIRWLGTQLPWQRSSGRDHMFVLGKISWDFRRYENQTWGNNLLLLDEMKAPYKLMIERNVWDSNDIGVPHPTHFHPHDDEDIENWQRRINSSKRRNLVSFAGASRKDPESIRSILIQQCKSNDEYCEFLDCKSGGCAKAENVITLFMESEFCLQPTGDSPTRKSVFDSLIAGCIPVLFSTFTAYYQYPWHLPEDRRSYSVFIDEDEVRRGNVDVVEVLKNVSADAKNEMRRYIVSELMPGLVYGDSNAKFEKFRDAFDISMDNMIHIMSSLN